MKSVTSSRNAAQRVVRLRELRELLEVVQARVAVREFRAREVAVDVLDDRPDGVGRRRAESAGASRRREQRAAGLDRRRRAARELDPPGPAFAERRERVGAGADRLPDGRGRALPDARKDLERPLPGQLVLRVDDDPQEGQHVLDVALLEEAHAGADLVRDAAPRQLDLQLERLVVRAIENREVREPLPLVVPLEQALRREARLVGNVGQRHDRGQRAAGSREACELLGELPRRCARSRRWRGARISRRRAVVARQAEGLRLGIALGEAEDVLEGGAAERVDRLRVVADDRHVAAGPGPCRPRCRPAGGSCPGTRPRGRRRRTPRAAAAASGLSSSRRFQARSRSS